MSSVLSRRDDRHRSVWRRLSIATAAMIVAGLFTLVGGETVAAQGTATGWRAPFSGPSAYEYLAPTQLTDPSQLNQAIGRERAEYIAKNLGLRRSRTLTEEQYVKFISGQGKNGDLASAAIAEESVRILTNTTGRPLACNVDSGGPSPTVLASYGLYVDEQCRLGSPANINAPTRQINEELTPSFLCPPSTVPRCGYIDRWMKQNGAAAALAQLYSSAYPSLVVYGYLCQQQSTTSQLATNTKKGVSVKVGLSMVPPLWLVNFALIYTLKPDLAALMPGWWAPIPQPVADAIWQAGAPGGNGLVPYADFASYFE